MRRIWYVENSTLPLRPFGVPRGFVLSTKVTFLEPATSGRQFAISMIIRDLVVPGQYAAASPRSGDLAYGGHTSSELMSHTHATQYNIPNIPGTQAHNPPCTGWGDKGLVGVGESYVTM
jgi:hypothetical protein